VKVGGYTIFSPSAVRVDVDHLGFGARLLLSEQVGRLVDSHIIIIPLYEMCSSTGFNNQVYSQPNAEYKLNNTTDNKKIRNKTKPNVKLTEHNT